MMFRLPRFLFGIFVIGLFPCFAYSADSDCVSLLNEDITYCASGNYKKLAILKESACKHVEEHRQTLIKEDASTTNRKLLNDLTEIHCGKDSDYYKSTNVQEVKEYAKIELANTEQAYRLIKMSYPDLNVKSCVLKTNVSIKGRPQDTLTCRQQGRQIQFEFDDLSDRDNSQNGTVYASLQQYFCGKVDKNLTSGACMDKVAKVWGKKIEPVAPKQSASVSKEECEKSCASKICRQVKENSVNYTCLQLNANEYAFKPDCESKCSGADKKCKTERNAQGMYVYACKTLPPLAENEYTDKATCEGKCQDGKCRYSTHKERGHIYTCDKKNNVAPGSSDEQSELKKDLKSNAQQIIDAYNERKAVLESQKQ